jgi:hypothetical protein
MFYRLSLVRYENLRSLSHYYGNSYCRYVILRAYRIEFLGNFTICASNWFYFKIVVQPTRQNGGALAQLQYLCKQACDLQRKTSSLCIAEH